MSETHYFNSVGKRVATADHHRNRGTCCKCNCLHCPYGTTLENLGLQFFSLEGSRFEVAKEILGLEAEEVFDVARMLLNEGYKKEEVFPQIDDGNKSNFRLVELKGYGCGVIEVQNEEVYKLYLHPRFRDQGLDLSIVNRYYRDAKEA